MTEKIVFTPNVPVQVALKFPDGKEVEGRFGNQMYYSLVDGRAMYLNPDVATKVNMLGPRKGEPFMICQRWSGKKTESKTWDVWRPEPDQQQPVRTAPPPKPAEVDLEQQLRASIKQVESRREAGASVVAPTPVALPIAEATSNRQSNGTNGHTNGNGVNATPERPKTKLEGALRTVVAACHSAREYAKQIGYEAMPPFTSEDIRTMANTIMIQDAGGKTWPRP